MLIDYFWREFPLMVPTIIVKQILMIIRLAVINYFANIFFNIIAIPIIIVILANDLIQEENSFPNMVH